MKNSTKRKLATGLIMVAGVAKILSLSGCDTSNNPTEIQLPGPKTHKISNKNNTLQFEIPYIALPAAPAPKHIQDLGDRIQEFIDADVSSFKDAVNYLISLNKKNPLIIEIDQDSDTTGLSWDGTKFVVSKKWLDNNMPSLIDLRTLFNSITAVRNADELLMALDASSQNIRGA